MLMELCAGGDLAHFLASQPGQRLPYSYAPRPGTHTMTQVIALDISKKYSRDGELR